MTKLGQHILGATIAVLVAAGPIQAQEPPPKDDIPEQAEKALKEGVQTILRALGALVDSIPQYEMPEVLENGDIIIRRKRPEEKEEPSDNTDST